MRIIFNTVQKITSSAAIRNFTLLNLEHNYFFYYIKKIFFINMIYGTFYFKNECTECSNNSICILS